MAAVRTVAATIVLGGRSGPSRTTTPLDVAGSPDLALEPAVVTARATHLAGTLARLRGDAELRLTERVVLGRAGEEPGRWTGTLRVEPDGVPVLHTSQELGPGGAGVGAAVHAQGVRDRARAGRVHCGRHDRRGLGPAAAAGRMDRDGLGRPPRRRGTPDRERGTVMDLVVAARRVLTGGAVRPARVGVAGGRIAAVAPWAEDLPADRTVVLDDDAVLLPGLVDTHVHVNEPGRTEWEGFATATAAAAAGGITTILDMPLNSLPPTLDPAALAVKRAAAAGRVHVDVGFWGGAVPGNLGALTALLDAGRVRREVLPARLRRARVPAARPGRAACRAGRVVHCGWPADRALRGPGDGPAEPEQPGLRATSSRPARPRRRPEPWPG